MIVFFKIDQIPKICIHECQFNQVPFFLFCTRDIALSIKFLKASIIGDVP